MISTGTVRSGGCLSIYVKTINLSSKFRLVFFNMKKRSRCIHSFLFNHRTSEWHRHLWLSTIDSFDSAIKLRAYLVKWWNERVVKNTLENDRAAEEFSFDLLENRLYRTQLQVNKTPSGFSPLTKLHSSEHAKELGNVTSNILFHLDIHCRI